MKYEKVDQQYYECSQGCDNKYCENLATKKRDGKFICNDCLDFEQAIDKHIFENYIKDSQGEY